MLLDVWSFFNGEGTFFNFIYLIFRLKGSNHFKWWRKHFNYCSAVFNPLAPEFYI